MIHNDDPSYTDSNITEPELYIGRVENKINKHKR